MEGGQGEHDTGLGKRGAGCGSGGAVRTAAVVVVVVVDEASLVTSRFGVKPFV